MQDYYSLIKEDIRKRLSSGRYYHSVCVSESCVKLAEKYGGDVSKALIAGIGHDVFKELPREQMLAFLKSENIVLSDIELNAPKLWHAIGGAAYLKKQYELSDDIVSAVRYHTTGKTGMTLLEKILYTADFISEDRDYNGVDTVRKLADISLESAMAEGLRFTVEDLSRKGVPIHPDTFEAYNEIMLEINTDERKN